MKLISKFKDYYDGAKCYSYCSNDFTYIRMQEQIRLEEYSKGSNFLFPCIEISKEYKYQIDRFIIGFCGKYYLGYRVKKEFKGLISTEIKTFDHTYDINVFKEALNKKMFKMHKTKLSWGSIFRSLKGGSVSEKMKDYMSRWSARNDRELKEQIEILKKLDLFKKYNTPVFVLTLDLPVNYNKTPLSYDNLIVNPKLEDYNFYKILAAPYAYQEIEMFLGNELMPRDNPDQITDDLILAKNHGFDKMSFRKFPTKKEKHIRRSKK